MINSLLSVSVVALNGALDSYKKIYPVINRDAEILFRLNRGYFVSVSDYYDDINTIELLPQVALPGQKYLTLQKKTNIREEYSMFGYHSWVWFLRPLFYYPIPDVLRLPVLVRPYPPGDYSSIFVSTPPQKNYQALRCSHYARGKRGNNLALRIQRREVNNKAKSSTRRSGRRNGSRK